MVNNKPTEKQINMIIYLWENCPRASFQKYWNVIPTHNKKYNNPKADYRNLIIYEYLLERLRSKRQASYMIQLLEEYNRGTSHRFRRLLLSLNN